MGSINPRIQATSLLGGGIDESRRFMPKLAN